jgi:hypothetical protein
MKNNSRSLITTYANVFEGGILPTCETIQQHVKLIEQADKHLPVNSTFIIITNTQTQSYEFISKNFKAATGVNPEELLEVGVSGFLGRMHPEDVEIWLGLMGELMDFCISSVEQEDRKRLEIQYNYRFQNGDGKYINLLESQIVLQMDNEGKPLVGMGHYTVFGNEEYNPIKGLVRKLNTDDKYETIFSKNFSKSKILAELSVREQEVIELLLQKKTSKEVADQLFVSSHTIDTHRRNIIRKLKLKSTVDLDNIFEVRN